MRGGIPAKGEGGRNGREAYTQNGSYNHKYHFFIGTTLNGGIWQSKFQCKTLHGRRSHKEGTSRDRDRQVRITSTKGGFIPSRGLDWE